MKTTSNNRVSIVVLCPEKMTYQKREISKETLKKAEDIIKKTNDCVNRVMDCTGGLKTNYVDPIESLIKMLPGEVEAIRIRNGIELAKQIDPKDEKSIGYEWTLEEFFEACKPKQV